MSENTKNQSPQTDGRDVDQDFYDRYLAGQDSQGSQEPGYDPFAEFSWDKRGEAIDYAEVHGADVANGPAWSQPEAEPGDWDDDEAAAVGAHEENRRAAEAYQPEEPDIEKTTELPIVTEPVQERVAEPAPVLSTSFKVLATPGARTPKSKVEVQQSAPDAAAQEPAEPARPTRPSTAHRKPKGTIRGAIDTVAAVAQTVRDTPDNLRDKRDEAVRGAARGVANAAKSAVGKVAGSTATSRAMGGAFSTATPSQMPSSGNVGGANWMDAPRPDSRPTDFANAVAATAEEFGIRRPQVQVPEAAARPPRSLSLAETAQLAAFNLPQIGAKLAGEYSQPATTGLLGERAVPGYTVSTEGPMLPVVQEDSAGQLFATPGTTKLPHAVRVPAPGEMPQREEQTITEPEPSEAPAAELEPEIVTEATPEPEAPAPLAEAPTKAPLETPRRFPTPKDLRVKKESAVQQAEQAAREAEQQPLLEALNHDSPEDEVKAPDDTHAPELNTPGVADVLDESESDPHSAPESDSERASRDRATRIGNNLGAWQQGSRDARQEIAREAFNNYADEAMEIGNSNPDHSTEDPYAAAYPDSYPDASEPAHEPEAPVESIPVGPMTEASNRGRHRKPMRVPLTGFLARMSNPDTAAPEAAPTRLSGVEDDEFAAVSASADWPENWERFDNELVADPTGIPEPIDVRDIEPRVSRLERARRAAANGWDRAVEYFAGRDIDPSEPERNGRTAKRQLALAVGFVVVAGATAGLLNAAESSVHAESVGKAPTASAPANPGAPVVTKIAPIVKGGGETGTTGGSVDSGKPRGKGDGGTGGTTTTTKTDQARTIHAGNEDLKISADGSEVTIQLERGGSVWDGLHQADEALHMSATDRAVDEAVKTMHLKPGQDRNMKVGSSYTFKVQGGKLVAK